MAVDQASFDAAMQNEENTKQYLITPVLAERWGGKPERMLMEFPISDGQIYVDEYGVGHRSEKKKFADYLLCWYRNIPLAIVEAKGRSHMADEGYQQAIDYARLLDVPFAYATNGDDLLEFDCLSGLSRAMKIGDFPYPDELWEQTHGDAAGTQPEQGGLDPGEPEQEGRAHDEPERVGLVHGESERGEHGHGSEGVDVDEPAGEGSEGVEEPVAPSLTEPSGAATRGSIPSSA